MGLIVVALLLLGAIYIDGKQFTAPLPTIKGRLLTPDEGCGFTKVKTTRIVNGSKTKPGAYPWMALIGYSTSDGDKFKCGGTMITSRHILTTATCTVYHGSPASFVRLGEYQTDSDTDGENQDINVAHIEKHPDMLKKFGNNIAILYLERDAEYTARVRPICLPVNEPIRSQSFVDTNPFVSGWARCKTCLGSNVLKHNQVPVHSNAFCSDLYIKKGVQKKSFPPSVLCAGNLDGDDSECIGDIGGPLTLPLFENGKFPYYQIGIVALNLKCGAKNSPDVYTSTQYFADWIQEMVNKQVDAVNA